MLLLHREFAFIRCCAVLDEHARRAPVALVHVLDGIARVVRCAARAFAAARHRRSGRRLGRGHIALLGVLRHHKGAALLLAARTVLVHFAALIVRLVAVAHAAARRLSRRLRRGGPHRLAVLILAERLEHAARHTIAVEQHRALLLGAEFLALIHPALAVRRVGVAVAAARLRWRIRHLPRALIVEVAKVDELARRALVALVLVLDGVALLVARQTVALAAARHLRRRRRLGRGHVAIAVIVRLQKVAAL